MQRISSRMTLYYKRVIPLVMLGFVLILIAVPFAAGQSPPWPAILVPLAICAFGYFVMRKLVFDLVDEAWDAGEALVIRNRDQEERIALSAIMNVNYSPFVNPPRVTLTLRTPGIFGDTITFCAPLRLIPFTKNPVVEDLIRRVDAARMRGR
jgi:hypothetical protein